jgi:hypothetical protein
MALACFEAMLYVASKKVVHSIDRRSKFSASGGGKAIIEGTGPFEGGKICINLYQ